MPRSLTGGREHAQHARLAGSGSPLLCTKNVLPNTRVRKKRALSSDVSFPPWASSWPPALKSREECGDAALLVCDASGGGRTRGSITSLGALSLSPSPDDDEIDLGNRGHVQSQVPAPSPIPARERPKPWHLRPDRPDAWPSYPLPPPSPLKVTEAVATTAISAPREARAALGKVSRGRGT